MIWKTLLVSVSIAAGMSGTVSAATSTKPDVTVTPFLQSVRVEAAETSKAFSVEISNNSKTTKTFNVTALDFGSLDESGGVIFAGSTSDQLLKKYGLASWLELSDKEVTVAAGKKTKIQATILNQPSLSPGGHYGAVIASLKSADTKGSNQVNIKQQLSTLVFATKVGGERYDLKLDNVEFAESPWKLPDSVDLRFYNPGNVHIVPRGEVKLLDSNNKTVKQGIINVDSGFVLPETYRKMDVKLTGLDRVKPWPANYKMEVNYRYDGLDKFATRSFDLKFINLPMLIVGLLLLIGIITAIAKIKRRKNSK